MLKTQKKMQSNFKKYKTLRNTYYKLTEQKG